MRPVSTHVLTFRGLYVAHDREPCKTAEPIEMSFGGRLAWVLETCIGNRRRCTMALSGEYDGSTGASSAMRPVAITTAAATC